MNAAIGLTPRSKSSASESSLLVDIAAAALVFMKKASYQSWLLPADTSLKSRAKIAKSPRFIFGDLFRRFRRTPASRRVVPHHLVELSSELDPVAFFPSVSPRAFKPFLRSLA